jgi:hypothetical protein
MGNSEIAESEVSHMAAIRSRQTLAARLVHSDPPNTHLQTIVLLWNHTPQIQQTGSRFELAAKDLCVREVAQDRRQANLCMVYGTAIYATKQGRSFFTHDFLLRLLIIIYTSSVGMKPLHPAVPHKHILWLLLLPSFKHLVNTSPSSAPGCSCECP